MKSLVIRCTLTASILCGCLAAQAEPALLTQKPAQAGAPQACSQDLAVLPDFLMTNDAGAADNRRYRGESAIASALERATREAASVQSDAECEKVLQRYLAAWREGHLAVESVAPASAGEPASPADTQPQAPSALADIRWLSSTTVLLTFPTFDASAEAPIRQLFKSHLSRLERTPHWIIDVRQNGGGSDATYHPIIQAVIGNPILMEAPEFLATTANIEGTARVCELFSPGDAACAKWADALVKAMRAAPPGSFVRHPDIAHAVTRIEPDPAKRKRPQRVAVLTDTACGSSCEQFLLAMRQSWNVKLMGRRSHGALDYSNLRQYRLPSGQRVLWYATSRSVRLPHLPVDALGVLPDVLLMPPANAAERAREIDFVQALLEGRAMAPAGR